MGLLKLFHKTSCFSTTQLSSSKYGENVKCQCIHIFTTWLEISKQILLTLLLYNIVHLFVNTKNLSIAVISVGSTWLSLSDQLSVIALNFIFFYSKIKLQKQHNRYMKSDSSFLRSCDMLTCFKWNKLMISVLSAEGKNTNCQNRLFYWISSVTASSGYLLHFYSMCILKGSSQ